MRLSLTTPSVHEFTPQAAGVTRVSTAPAALTVHRLAPELHGGEAIEAAVLAQQRGLLVCQRPPLHHLLPVHPDPVVNICLKNVKEKGELTLKMSAKFLQNIRPA